MKLAVEGGQLSPGGDVAVEIESISSSGLAVLHAPDPPGDIHEHLLSTVPGGDIISFVHEENGVRANIQASLVWIELDKGSTASRLELIVDTSDQPGWLAFGGAAASSSSET
jgi:hypothetical protein